MIPLGAGSYLMRFFDQWFNTARPIHKKDSSSTMAIQWSGTRLGFAVNVAVSRSSVGV